jgi:hypothetical protein
MLQAQSEGKVVGITPISISKEDLEQLRKLVKSSTTRDIVKNEKIKKLAGGWCALCAGIPTKIPRFDYHGAIRLERYRDSCAEAQFSSCPERRG